MMKKMILAAMVMCMVGGAWAQEADEGWISLFNGKDLAGWRASENKGTWSVKDGLLITHGPRSHLFYVGPVNNAQFKNFEFKCVIKTEPGSNSGMYFATAYQETDWPAKGYEVQVNNTHSDPKKTGGLYNIRDVMNHSPARDGEWFTQHIIVRGRQIIVKVNDTTTVMYNEPESVSNSNAGRKLSAGTLCLQGHDPKSVVYYKSVAIKPLPDDAREKIRVGVLTGGHDFERDHFFKLFEGYDDIEYMECEQKDHSEVFEDISKWDFDVLVCYNMTQNISEKRRANLLKLLENGVGLVAFHHNMGAFQEWSEYKKIIGARYNLKAAEVDGVQVPGSTYKHDIDMNCKIASQRNPITRGLSDFQIHDEGYKGVSFEPDNRVFLTTDHPDSDPTVGWTRRYANARVVGLMLGHDGKAYANENLRAIVANSIRYTAGRLAPQRSPRTQR